MNEATLCDRIALIQNGEFMQVDTPQNIVDAYPEILWAVQSNQMHKLLNDLRNHPSITSSFSFGETIHITVKEGITTDELRSYLTEKGHNEISIQAIQATVEDCFMLLSNNTHKPLKPLTPEGEKNIPNN